MIENWPPDVQRLLLALDAEPRSKSDLLARADLQDGQWRPAIDYLLSRGWCVRTGELRWTRYALKREDFGFGPGHMDLEHEVSHETDPEEQVPSASSGVHSETGNSAAATTGSTTDTASGDPVVAAILGALSYVPQSRAEIIALSGIDETDWPRAITAIVENGLAIRTGSKRGTRYLLTVDGHGASTSELAPERADGRETGSMRERPSTPSPTRSFVEASYHDIVDELLGVFLLREPESEEYRPQPPPPPSLVRALEAAGAEVIDQRTRGGPLWVVETTEARSAIATAARTFNVQFTRAANSQACGGRPGWWTRDDG
jgi:hypothetical protein